MDRPETGLTVVVPAYNELDALAPVMEELVTIMEGGGHAFEIIVIDDGSDDGTSEIAAGFSDPVRTIRHESNKGYGSALKTGIRAARYAVVCTTDADGTYPNERIPDLFEHYLENECDMVVGARTGDNVSIPLIRRPAKWAIGKLANYMVNYRIPDINSGLRLFRRDLVMKMFRILPDGFSISTNVTMAMISHDYKVDFLPIDYHARHRQLENPPHPRHPQLHQADQQDGPVLRPGSDFPALERNFVPARRRLGPVFKNTIWGSSPT